MEEFDFYENDFLPVTQYTVQLFYSLKKNNVHTYIDEPAPVQIASGVLIKTKSKYFLLTCKHVFDGINTEDVIILTKLGFAVRLPKEVKFINNDNNSIDLALVQLNIVRVKELKTRYSFLPMKNLGFDHEFDEDLWYMMHGFINRRTRLKSDAFYTEPFGFLTGFRRYRKIEKLGFHYDNNVTLEYNRRKQSYLDDDKPIFGYKDLKGLSGGGIWLSVEGSKSDTYNYILVGIMIEERMDRGFIIGTKVSLIKELLN